MSIDRKLAAIMFTDIVGYTQQMSENEDKAFQLIQKKRSLLLPLLEKYEGKLIKEIGDGTLTRYFNVDNAIKCASKFQSNTTDDLNVRAGIHTGEVIIDNEDVFGDVVNIASRLESFALPGSVFVSKETINKLNINDDFELVCLGLQSLKGVGRLIETYAIKAKGLTVPDPKDYKQNKVEVHSDDEIPSIAVIPFDNKGAEEDMFYAYGISADLISDCSSAGLIRVASLKDIEKMDYKNIGSVKIAEKLSVRYISQGTLWKMGDMFQLSIELYDVKNDKVVWSDRWQEKWDNLPLIKVSLTDGLLKTLNTESKVKNNLDTINAKAYEYYLKAKQLSKDLEGATKNEKDKQMSSLEKRINQALDLDPNLLCAKRLLADIIPLENKAKSISILKETLLQAEKIDNKREIALCLSQLSESSMQQWRMQNDNKELNESIKYAEKCYIIAKDLEDYDVILSSSRQYSYALLAQRDDEKALLYMHRCIDACEKTENWFELIASYMIAGMVYKLRGDYNRSIEYSKLAIDISQKSDRYLNEYIYTLYNLIVLSYIEDESWSQAIKSINIFFEGYDDYRGIYFSDQNEIEFKTYRIFAQALSGAHYDKEEFSKLISKVEEISNNMKDGTLRPLNKFFLNANFNYNYYRITNNAEYLKTACQIIEQGSELARTQQLKDTYLNYPPHKTILDA